MHKKFEINWKKIKGGCQLGGKVVTHNSNNDLPLHMKIYAVPWLGFQTKIRLYRIFIFNYVEILPVHCLKISFHLKMIG